MPLLGYVVEITRRSRLRLTETGLYRGQRRPGEFLRQLAPMPDGGNSRWIMCLPQAVQKGSRIGTMITQATMASSAKGTPMRRKSTKR